MKQENSHIFVVIILVVCNRSVEVRGSSSVFEYLEELTALEAYRFGDSSAEVSDFHIFSDSFKLHLQMFSGYCLLDYLHLVLYNRIQERNSVLEVEH